jgi:hypothetical protein
MPIKRAVPLAEVEHVRHYNLEPMHPIYVQFLAMNLGNPRSAKTNLEETPCLRKLQNIIRWQRNITRMPRGITMKPQSITTPGSMRRQATTLTRLGGMQFTVAIILTKRRRPMVQSTERCNSGVQYGFNLLSNTTESSGIVRGFLLHVCLFLRVYRLGGLSKLTG